MAQLEELTHTRREIATILMLFVMCLLVGTVFYYFVEKHSPVDSFYLASMTMTTVGYGDITPQTELGKLFTAFYAFTGIAIFLGLANAIFHNVLVESLRRRNRARRDSSSHQER